MDRSALPVVVIGAGPVGLAAATRLIHEGHTPLVLESGATVGAAVRSWGHVKLFSPWKYNVDDVARGMLEAEGWTMPDGEAYHTGHELVDRYLIPLAKLPEIAPHVKLNSEVTVVARQSLDKMKSPGREEQPFVVRYRNSDGIEQEVLAKAVIDASGTYWRPNPLGANGILAIGEREAAAAINHGIPDALGRDRDRYGGKRVMVVGSGHSAFNVLLDLVQLTEQEPATEIVWAVRKPASKVNFGGGENDQLPARGQLGERLKEQLASGAMRLATDFPITRLTLTGDGVVAHSGERVLDPVDEIITTTGFRPDLTPLSELRLELDPVVESPRALAPLIDPNIHSCGTVRPHGAEELRHPEADFFIVGMKSYGRAPTFLMLTGYEQVRSVVAAISGDWERAREVHLELPETGVCTLDPIAGDDAACCGPALVQPAVAREVAGIAVGTGVTLAGDSANRGCCG